MMRALCLALLLPGAALGAGLDCTFTTICSPLTGCQTNDGVPFVFDVTGGGFSFMTGEGLILGIPLSNTTPPALSVLFDTAHDSTILLSVTPSGEAVMTQHDIALGDRIQAISYFGTCEPRT